MFGDADEEPGIQRTDDNLYAESDCAEGQREGTPNPWVVQGSTVFWKTSIMIINHL